jgi:hypothetical protein
MILQQQVCQSETVIPGRILGLLEAPHEEIDGFLVIPPIDRQKPGGLGIHDWR